MYNEIMARFEQSPPALFHRAQEEVFLLMRKDTLPRFLLSEECRAYAVQREA